MFCCKTKMKPLYWFTLKHTHSLQVLSLCQLSLLTLFSVETSIHPLSVTALSHLWGHRVFAGANPSCLWARASRLYKSPAHCRFLRDGRDCHAKCQPDIRSKPGFSILLKETSTWSSAWTNTIPITSLPALPAETHAWVFFCYIFEKYLNIPAAINKSNALMRKILIFIHLQHFQLNFS